MRSASLDCVKPRQHDQHTLSPHTPNGENGVIAVLNTLNGAGSRCWIDVHTRSVDADRHDTAAARVSPRTGVGVAGHA